MPTILTCSSPDSALKLCVNNLDWTFTEKAAHEVTSVAEV